MSIGKLDLTEKIKLLCNRNQENLLECRKEDTTEIEKHSRIILEQYVSILSNSSVAFDKEVGVSNTKQAKILSLQETLALEKLTWL